MSERLQLALQRLDGLLTAQGNPVMRGLQPAVGEKDIRAQLNPLGLDPPQDLIAWFGWHNGYDNREGEDWEGWLGPAFFPYSLAEACVAYAEILETLELEIEHSGSTDGTQWFPLLTRDGVTCLMDCRPDPFGRGAVAVWDRMDLTPPNKRPTTLAEPIELWTRYIETGQWVWDSKQGWRDLRDEAELAAHLWSI